MATRTSRCISNSININNNNSSNNNNSTSSSLSPVSRRTTHTIPTPRNTCPRGTGLPTLQTGTSTPCQANLGRDWSQTVSSFLILLNFLLSYLVNGLTPTILFQIHPMEMCPDFQTRTLGTISRTSCVSRVSTCTDLSMTSLQPPQRATPPPTGASSGRSSFEDPERPARFL